MPIEPAELKTGGTVSYFYLKDSLGNTLTGELTQAFIVKVQYLYT